MTWMRHLPIASLLNTALKIRGICTRSVNIRYMYMAESLCTPDHHPPISFFQRRIPNALPLCSYNQSSTLMRRLSIRLWSVAVGICAWFSYKTTSNVRRWCWDVEEASVPVHSTRSESPQWGCDQDSQVLPLQTLTHHVFKELLALCTAALSGWNRIRPLSSSEGKHANAFYTILCFRLFSLGNNKISA